MPQYAFRCSQCGTEFELTRPMSQASDQAICPHDGSPASRIFTMPSWGGKPGSSSGDGHGHSHGPGTAPHSH
jgi:putative FmdB family regulatory protein